MNGNDNRLPIDIKGAQQLEPGYRIPSKIAKVGTQEFEGWELSSHVPNLPPTQRYKVEVSPEDLFDAETIASFEGKPLTFFHAPNNEVTSDNWKNTAIGHVQNVKQEGDYLTADVFLYDAEAIEAIKNYQIKELSCGYRSFIEPTTTTGIDFKKTHIRGDHVAIVDVCRSGHDVKLGDSAVSMKAKIAALKGQQKLGDEGETPDTIDTLLIQMSDYVQLLAESADEATKEIGEILTGLIGQAQSLSASPSPTSEVKQGDAASEITSVPENTEATDDKSLIETLKKQLEELTEKLKALEEENARLKAENELAETEAEAKSTFGDGAIGHGRTARQIKENVIIAKGLVTQLEARKLGDSAINGKYDYLINRQREQNKPRFNLGDRKPTKSASQRLGGR
ncbi:MAG: DUF2213 domain-containing protein [Candidatus Arsenophonus phytopathogenicus]